MGDELNQCVTYFTQGGPVQWIVGGLLVIVGLVSSLSKWNVPDFIKKALTSEANKTPKSK